MAISHTMAAGMGGMRAAGDLVARMQMTKGMRLPEAKKYVADKLKISVEELADPIVMDEIREDLNIGRLHAYPNEAKGIEAKVNIEKVLDIEINSVKRFKERTR
jgi:hypothetical protein